MNERIPALKKWKGRMNVLAFLDEERPFNRLAMASMIINEVNDFTVNKTNVSMFMDSKVGENCGEHFKFMNMLLLMLKEFVIGMGNSSK